MGCVAHDTNFPFHFFQIPELRHSNDTQKHIHSVESMYYNLHGSI